MSWGWGLFYLTAVTGLTMAAIGLRFGVGWPELEPDKDTE